MNNKRLGYMIGIPLIIIAFLGLSLSHDISVLVFAIVFIVGGSILIGKLSFRKKETEIQWEAL